MMSLYAWATDFEHRVKHIGNTKLLVRVVRAQERAKAAYQEASGLYDEYMKTKDNNDTQ